MDGLKAEDLLDIYTRSDTEVLNLQWKNPIGTFGAFYLAAAIENMNQASAIAAFSKRSSDFKNSVLVSDYLSALFMCNLHDIDMKNTVVQLGRFEHISLSASKVKNLTLDDCYIKHLDITESSPVNMRLVGCAITALDGVSGEANLPTWIQNPIVEKYQELATLSALRHAGLKFSQTFLLSSLRKLFLQPGAGRKESSMYKGYGDATGKKVCEQVISLLVREKFCSLFKGASEAVFLPNRSMIARVRKILNEMTLSSDTLWKEASHLGD